MKKALLSLLTLALLLGFAAPAHAAFACQDTITVTSNSAYLPATLTNFPTTYYLTDNHLKTVANGGCMTSANAYDLQYATVSGCLSGTIPFEIVPGTYDGSAGTIEVHFLAGTLAAGSTFYACNGDASRTTDPSSTSAWPSDVKGKWHLPNGASLSGSDSTSFNHALSVNGSVTAGAAQIDGGAVFAGGNGDYLSGADSSDYDFTTTLTLAGWIKTNDSGNTLLILNRDNGSGGAGSTGREFQFRKNSSNQLEFIGFNGSANTVHSTGTINSNAQTHVAVTYDGTTVRLYIGGAADGTMSMSGSLNSGSGASLLLGAFQGGVLSWVSGIDEFLISSATYSPNKVTADYNDGLGNLLSHSWGTLGTSCTPRFTLLGVSSC